MARTPKAVRRNAGYCICPERPAAEKAGTCRWGRCTEFRCPRCRGELGGYGPFSCPGHGHPRSMRYPGMEQPGRWDFGRDEFVPSRAAVKPSIARRRNRKPTKPSQ